MILSLIKNFINKYHGFFFLFAYKKIDVTKLASETIEKKKEEISCFSLSSNIIKIFEHNGKKCFFRECKKHLKFKDYVDETIDEFYSIAATKTELINFDQRNPIQDCFSNSEISELKKHIDKCKAKPNFYKKIKKLDAVLKNSSFDIWSGKISIPREKLEEAGLSSCPQNLNSIFVFFLTFLEKSVRNYKFHIFVSIGDYESFSACRSIATYKFAKILGVERLVASAKIIRLLVDGKSYYGVASPMVDGKRAFDCSYNITPLLQRELVILHVLDSLCIQPDHWVNNYNIIANEHKEAESVCAFDNDCNWTFFPWMNISFISMCDGASIVNRNGLLNIPHLDSEFSYNILNIKIKSIQYELNSYLNKFQIWALICRLKALQKLIRKTSLANCKFVVEATDWNDSDVQMDLSGKYGNSYLVQYFRKEEIEMKKRKGFKYRVIKFT